MDHKAFQLERKYGMIYDHQIDWCIVLQYRLALFWGIYIYLIIIFWLTSINELFIFPVEFGIKIIQRIFICHSIKVPSKFNWISRNSLSIFEIIEYLNTMRTFFKIILEAGLWNEKEEKGKNWFSKFRDIGKIVYLSKQYTLLTKFWTAKNCFASELTFYISHMRTSKE